MGSDNPHEDIERLRALIASREPTELKRYIAPIRFGQALVPGTVSQAIGTTQYRRLESGLIVPVAAVRTVAPIDLVKTFITASDLVDAPVSEHEARSEMEAVSRADLVEVAKFVASTLSRWRNPTYSNKDNDLHFARLWFRSPTLDKLLEILRDPQRGLVAPQALLVLLNLAFTLDQDPEVPDQGSVNIITALLAVMETLGGEAAGAQETVLGEGPGKLGREIIANQLFNAPVEIRGILGRFARRWLQMPSEYATDPRVIDLLQTYQTATGVSLEDLTVICIGLIAGSLQGRILFNRSDFANLNWSDDRLDSAINLISAEVAELQTVVRQLTGARGVEWEFSAFEQFPIVRLHDQSLLLIDPLFLLRRVFGWLPVFDVETALRSDGTAESQKRAKQFVNSVRHLAEAYALEVIESTVQRVGQNRIYREDAIQAAYGKKGTQLADCVIDYGDAWIVVEITSSQLTRESVSGVSDEHVVNDLDKLIGKVTQIDSTISSIRANESALTSTAPLDHRTFLPLLVVTEGFPANPISLTLIRQMVTKADLLRGSDVAELEIVDTAELELMEAVQEQDGLSLRQLIQMKGSAGLRNASMLDYIVAELNKQPEFSSRLNQLFDAAFAPALDAFRQKDN